MTSRRPSPSASLPVAMALLWGLSPSSALAGGTELGVVVPAESSGGTTAAVRVEAHELGRVGAVERVGLLPEQVALEARVDTGAETSSIHAADVQRFERDGEPWVRFRIPGDRLQQGNGQDVTSFLEDGLRLERPVSRNIRIKRKDAPSVRRAVVLLRVLLGDVVLEREFSLADREGFEYPVLLGRNLLRNVAVVDVALTHLVEPEWPEER